MHCALVPNADRSKVLVVEGALPAVESARIRTPHVAQTLARELGLDAPFLRLATPLRDAAGRLTTALFEADAPRSLERGGWIDVAEAPALAPKSAMKWPRG